jgi:hypothetical protein
LFVSAALLAAGQAGATSCALTFFGDDTGIITWQSNRLDSPLDPDSQRLAIHVLRQDGNDYAGAVSNCAGIKTKLVGQARNLSFDFLNETTEPSVHIGAGAPRISVDVDTDEDTVADYYVYLSAFYCSVPLSENPGWSRSDFTGRISAGCAFYTSSGELFTSDGVKSAWTLFAEAHPTYRVLNAYLVMDEEGTAFVDRLAFHNKMYQKAGTTSAAVKSCASESAC